MEPYLGEIRMFAGAYAPENWAFCDGSLLQVSAYEALFSLIGTTYGGTGTTSFNLPDLRSRIPVGAGAPTDGRAQYNYGAKGGAEAVTLQPNNLPPHTHTFTAVTNNATTTDPNGAYYGSVPLQTVNSVSAGELYVSTTTTGYQARPFNAAAVLPSGGSGVHENRMPTKAINYIIALQGIYPVRP